jgi:hypothetical protein
VKSLLAKDLGSGFKDVFSSHDHLPTERLVENNLSELQHGVKRTKGP